MEYVGWALLGMVGYSLVTLLVKLATRGGEVSSFYVLALAVLIVGSVPGLSLFQTVQNSC